MSRPLILMWTLRTSNSSTNIAVPAQHSKSWRKSQSFQPAVKVFSSHSVADLLPMLFTIIVWMIKCKKFQDSHSTARTSTSPINLHYLFLYTKISLSTVFNILRNTRGASYRLSISRLPALSAQTAGSPLSPNNSLSITASSNTKLTSSFSTGWNSTVITFISSLYDLITTHIITPHSGVYHGI